MTEKPLKILMVNKFYHSFGGAETCLFATKKAFEAEGHKVIIFSMQHPKNLSCPQEDYFSEYLDFSGETKYTFPQKLRVSAKLIYNFEARKKIAALIKKEKPDIAHLHNIYHQLSPSIVTPLYNAGIPTLMTCHDYKLICLNYKMVRYGKTCEACIGQSFRHALFSKCVKGSFFKTTLNYIEHLVHKTLSLYEKIDLLVTPSDFMRCEHIKMGLDGKRFATIENFIDYEKYQPKYDHEGYVLFFGRLSFEKGIGTLIRAMKDHPDIPLKIAGSGPEEPRLKYLSEELGATNVKFVGYMSGNRLTELVRNAAFICIPSEWYENCSMTVLESFAYGKPVIGSDIGGIPEQIIHGRNGYLHPMGDRHKLGELIYKLYSDNSLIRKMGLEARKTVETKYSLERHYKKLLQTYQRLIEINAGTETAK